MKLPSVSVPINVPISEYVQNLLANIGKQLGEEGFIFIGGLIPYKKSIGGGWDLDLDKNTIRLSNINESQSARASMALLAYLMESMQGDLEEEDSVEKLLDKQIPS